MQAKASPRALYDFPMADSSIPRSEYPRPDFRRDDSSWLNLNGQWEFAFDEAAYATTTALDAFVAQQPHFDGTIQVPFAFQSKLSGIGDTSFHDYMWYARDFETPTQWAADNKRGLLHFGAVDYYCKIWVNQSYVGEHLGGHIGFQLDVSPFLKPGQVNRVIVYVEDTQSITQPRGKQFWKPQSEFCFYTRTSGIWQTVWLEAVPRVYLNRLQVQPDIDSQELALLVDADGDELKPEIYWLQIQVSLVGQPVWRGEFSLMGGIRAGNRKLMGNIPLPAAWLWSPETPHLYDLRLTLFCGKQQLDVVESYFGMRKIAVNNGQVWLNNQPYYLRLVLDQGYFPDSLLTAPNDEALRGDIEWAKAFGFNGARKHQKVEDPRWLYWADRLGLLVWDEMPSAYEWNALAESPFIQEWLQVLVRDYNHPCVIAWVPFNESWGIEQVAVSVDQQEFVRNVVALTRAMDKSRLVVDNDGWEHQGRIGDLLTIHDYTAHGPHLLERYAAFKQSNLATHLPVVSNRPLFLDQAAYQGEPVIFSEFGGMSLIPTAFEAVAHNLGEWGYSNAPDMLALVEQYRGLMVALQELGFSSGFCYTQLTDVEQEVNGLLTYDRKPKVDPAIIAAINQIPSLTYPRMTETSANNPMLVG